MELAVVDSNGCEIKEKRSNIQSYALSSQKGKINLQILYANGVVKNLSRVISVFSDLSCTVIKFKNETYLISV